MRQNLGLIFSSLILFMLFTASISGCSTLLSDKSQIVTFQSTPTGATVSVNGTKIGVTPITTLIEKKSGQILTISKEGYKTFSTAMTTTIDAWFWVNILNTGIGSITDLVTGEMI